MTTRTDINGWAGGALLGGGCSSPLPLYCFEQ
jgi:hypothetical protein